MQETCIICLENGEITSYSHTCGNYPIHNKCFNEWDKEHNNECFVCREPIIQISQPEIDNQTLLIARQDTVCNRLYWCKRITLIIILLGLMIIPLIFIFIYFV